MNSLTLLLGDELRGFYRSRMMLFLWIGLPVMVVLLHVFQPGDTPELGFAALAGLVVGSVGGTLGSAMLAVSIIHEHSAHVYDLFLIRPVPRRNLLLAKFFAVLACIAMAGLIAHGVGIALDLALHGAWPERAVTRLVESSALTIAGLTASCAAGVLIGVATRSVLVGVVLVVYVGNQVSGLPLVPVLLGVREHVEIYAVLIGAFLALAMLVAAILIFERKDM